MKKNNWMSDFYGLSWYNLEKGDDPTKHPPNPCLVEWRVDVRDQEKVWLAQRLGYHLVETFIEFQTSIDGEYELLPGVRRAKKLDLKSVLEITRLCLSQNDMFITRFKNKEYFTTEQCERYYDLMVSNNFNDRNSLTVVAEDEIGVCGFFMLKEVKPGIQKGILTGVLPRARGRKLHLKMQYTCFCLLETPFQIINTTQLHNFYTINNHIREKRILEKIEHVFYRKNM